MSNFNRRSVFLVVLSLLWIGLIYGQKADFSAPVTAGCSPLIVNFQDQSTGNIKSWVWDFGNGATSTLQNPSTTYFKAGIYAVTLTVTSAQGTSTITKQQFVTIYGKPLMNFKVNDSAGCFPVRSQFTDLSTPSNGTSNTIWLWDFGDGTQSNQQNPLNVYKASGNYTVTLKLTNDKGCYNVLSKPAFIKVAGGVKSDFTNSDPTVCRPPFRVNFNNSATGPGTLTYLWNFGDGTTSTAKDTSHIYTKTGSYTVSLTTTSSNGCSDTLRKIKVLNFLNIKPVIIAPDSLCVFTRAVFSDTSKPIALSSKWIFGDGTFSDSTKPIKQYNTPSVYTVKLINTYSYCTDSTTKKISVFAKPVADFSANNRNRCQPSLKVDFTDLSSNAVGWKWDFGDSTAPSTSKNPSHTYTKFGSYDVKLIVRNAAGCTDSVIKRAYIKISSPTIAFPTFPLQGCLPFAPPISADISTVDSVATYKWDFGDGSPFGNTGSPNHTYTTPGAYTLTLTITTSTGCTVSNSYADAVVTGAHSVVAFNAVPNPVCALKQVQFTDASTASPNQINQWHWIFSDGTISNLQNPLYNFSDTGSIDVTLIVSNNGCMDSLTKKKYVQVEPPIAKFGFTIDCNNRLFIQFSDSSIVDNTKPLSWNWDFGDGTTSTAQNPSHTFAALKLYNVTLTVSNGSCSDTRVIPILLFKENPDFVADRTTACHQAYIAFNATNINTANITGYNWLTGDGQRIFDTKPAAVNLYQSPGTYTVSLSITDTYGCIQTISKSNYIQINGPLPNFSSLNPSGCAGLNVVFNDATKPDGVSKLTNWKWDFGDGNIQSFTNAPFTHIYSNPGTYQVKLTVTDAAGCIDSIQKIDFIHTTNPKADFSADTLACPGSTVNFTNLSTGTYSMNVWDLGNGTTSNQSQPSVVYTNSGYYDIKLSITDVAGCTDSMVKRKYIRVDKPVAQFNVSDSVSSCTPLEVDFTNTSLYSSSFVWNLNGGVSTIANPIQYYVAVGTYPVQLIVTSPGGCIDSISKNITVYDTTGSKITYSPLSGCTPLSVSLKGYSPGPLTYTWDFGDGTLVTNNSTAESHVYYSFGTFIPKIIMTDHSGCVIPVTGADTIQIIGAVPKFGLNKKLLCDSGLVSFIDSTTFNDPITSYNWSFGDGDSSHLTQPVHYYNGPGFYTVVLNVKTQSGCTDTFQLSNVIKIVNSPLFSIVGDSIVCATGFLQDTGVYTRMDTSAVQWAWTFPNGNSSFLQNPGSQQYNNAGNFVITSVATNSSGCSIAVTKNIYIIPLPVITMPPTLIKQAGYPITIPATYSPGVVSYIWQPVTDLSCDNCPQPIATNKFNTKYLVSVTDSNNCKNSKEIQIIVTCKGANVFVPNTFSPNGDGSNDIFYVRGRGLERVKSLRIFNRWGQVVFEQSNFPVNDPAYGWDGKFKGAKPIPDVYIYQLEVFCENSDIIHFEGNVALIK